MGGLLGQCHPFVIVRHMAIFNLFLSLRCKDTTKYANYQIKLEILCFVFLPKASFWLEVSVYSSYTLFFAKSVTF